MIENANVLYNVAIWDEVTGGEPSVYGYAIVAASDDEAESIALSIHQAENGDTGNARIDEELTYEINLAPDKNGQLYTVQINQA